MKIMHLLPALSSGGVEQVVLELCQGMTAQGVESCVVSAGGRMVKAVEAAGAKHITHALEKKNLHLIPEIWSIARVLREERPDIVHVHSRVPAWVVHFAYKLLNDEEKPVLVSSFHGFHSVNSYSRIMTQGDAIIAVSQCIRDHILNSYPGVPEQRIHVIPNSIDTSLNYPGYVPDPSWLARWQAEHRELDGRFVLCLPGRISRIKGQTELPSIMTRLLSLGVPAHALIVGETKRGKERFLKELKMRYRQAGVSEHVSWLGHRSDLRQVMSVSNVVLSLSLQPESFGKTTLEALALGKPVAGFDHGGVSEQLEEYLPEGLVPTGDAGAMADLLARWYAAPPRLVKPVGSPYLRQDMIQAHLNLYRSLL